MVTLDEHGLLIAHGQPLCRSGLKSIASDDLGLRVLAEAGAMDRVVTALDVDPRINMLVTALDLPGLEGVDGLSRIRERWPPLRVLVILWPMETDHADAALSAGVHGCVSIEASTEEYSTAFSRVLAGETYTPHHVQADRARANGPQSAQKLTARQRDVVDLLVRGMSAKQIARELGLAIGTVRTHTQAAYRTLGVRNRVEAHTAMRRAPAR